MRITSFGTRRLFGLFDHDVPLNKEERLTLIHGPNGFGKTTLLRLLRDFFEGKFAEFGKIPLASFYINLEGEKSITVTKIIDPDEASATPTCLVRLTEPPQKTLQHVILVPDYDQYILDELAKRAPYIQKAGRDLWEDVRDGELLGTEELVGRFGLRKSPAKDSGEYPEWLKEIIGSVCVRLIETQRLILERQSHRRLGARSIPHSTATVIDYAQQLAAKIQENFNDYGRLSQQLDRTFVIRLLKRDFEVHEASPVDSVSSKVEKLNEKRRRLRESGLLSRDDEALPSPEAPNYMIDQILNAYLQDVESKLAVFDKLLERTELLQSVVDAHLEFKRMVFSRQFGFQFRATYDKRSRILPANLSSGEQHLLILFYDLLFNDAENSLILIDEPEISLHVDWQLSFLGDLRRIVSIVPHDIVLATHSPQIINNHWDLTVALNRPQGTEA